MALLAGLFSALGGRKKIFDTIQNTVSRVAEGIKGKKKFGSILKDVAKGAFKDVISPSAIENLKDFASDELNKRVDRTLTKFAPTLADKRGVISTKDTLGDKILDLDESIKIDPEEETQAEVIKKVKELMPKKRKARKKKAPKKKAVTKKKAPKAKKTKAKRKKKVRSAAQKLADKKRMAALRAKIGKKKKFKSEL